jgi:hypothetical protein
VILLDVNLVVYAFNSGADEHGAVRRWLEEQVRAGVAIGVPWHTILGLLRLSTNPRVFSPPLTMNDALEVAQSLLDNANVFIPQPTERHMPLLSTLLKGERISGNLVSDAHLAALAIEHGLVLCSTDSDFARFRGLRWTNPLAT